MTILPTLDIFLTLLHFVNFSSNLSTSRGKMFSTVPTCHLILLLQKGFIYTIRNSNSSAAECSLSTHSQTSKELFKVLTKQRSKYFRNVCHLKHWELFLRSTKFYLNWWCETYYMLYVFMFSNFVTHQYLIHVLNILYLHYVKNFPTNIESKASTEMPCLLLPRSVGLTSSKVN